MKTFWICTGLIALGISSFITADPKTHKPPLPDTPQVTTEIAKDRCVDDSGSDTRRIEIMWDHDTAIKIGATAERLCREGLMSRHEAIESAAQALAYAAGRPAPLSGH